MAQTGFVSGLYLVGLCFGLLFKKKIPFPFICLSAFLWGSIFYVLAALLCMGTGIPYTLRTMLVLAGLGIAILALWNARKGNWRLSQGEGSWVIITFGLVFLLSLAATLYNFSAVSSDSYYQVMVGREIAFDGLSTPVMGQLVLVGPFMLVMQSASVLIGMDYLYAIAPLFSISLFCLFVYFCFRSIRSKFTGRFFPLLISTLAALAFYSSDLFIFQIFYIHTNLAASAYLFVFFGACWLAAADENHTWLVFAGLAIIAFSLVRIESIVFSLAFLFLAFTTLRFSVRVRWYVYLPFFVSMLLWYGLVYARIIETSGFINRPRLLVIMAALVGMGALLFILHYPTLQAWIQKYLPYGVGIGVILASAGLLIVNAENTSISLVMIGRNMLTIGRWGGLWYSVIALIVLTFVWRRKPIQGGGMPYEQFVTLGFLLFFVLLVALGGIRENPYRLFWYDSGNRMLTHIVPVIFYYFVIKLAPGFAEIVSINRIEARPET
jgi:hypothetical protein